MKQNKKILEETTLLQICYEILTNYKIDLNLYIIDVYDDDEVKEEERKKLYQSIFDTIIDYFLEINLFFHYDYMSNGVYENFVFDYSSVSYDFSIMSTEGKSRFGILNVYLMFRSGMVLSKKNIEQAYGCEMSNTKMQRIFKQIELVTGNHIITRNDLMYAFEEGE